MATTRKKPTGNAPADVMKPMPKVTTELPPVGSIEGRIIAHEALARAEEKMAANPPASPLEEAKLITSEVEAAQARRAAAAIPVIQLPVETPVPPPAGVQAPPPPVDMASLMNAAQEAHAKGDLVRSESLYRAMLDMNWAEPEILRRVGELCLAQSRHGDALPMMLKSLALHSYDARTNAQAGVCASFLGRYDEAEHYYKRAIEISPHFPLARWNNSLLLLYRGDYAKGWDEYRWGTLLGVRPNRHILPQWDGYAYRSENPNNRKTLYIWSEQGFGDGLMFLRFTQGLKDKFGFKRIVLEVQAPLLPLLWDYDRYDIDHVVASQVDGGFVEAFDEHISLAELPRVLGIRPFSIPSAPYLSVPPNPPAQQVLSAWRAAKKAEGKLLVGICWKGNPGHVNDKARSVDIERFAELAKVPGVQLVPLVPGEKPPFCPDAFQLPSFEATAQVMNALDLVVSVDTAIVHLAGAIGKECWCLSPKACDWRWYLDPEDSEKAIWYDSLSILRQAVQGEWAEVFADVAIRLEQRQEAAGWRFASIGVGDPDGWWQWKGPNGETGADGLAPGPNALDGAAAEFKPDAFFGSGATP